MATEPTALIGDYSTVILDDEEFVSLFRQYRPQVFADTLEVFPDLLLSEGEKSAVQNLSRRMGTPYRLNLGIYRDGQFVGWSFGVQASGDTFSMINTGILPDHQGRGVYTALLRRILEILKAEGFQVLVSRHVVTNNRLGSEAQSRVRDHAFRALGHFRLAGPPLIFLQPSPTKAIGFSRRATDSRRRAEANSQDMNIRI